MKDKNAFIILSSVIALVVLISVFTLPHLRIESSSDVFLSKHDPEVIAERSMEKMFKDSGTILVVLESKDTLLSTSIITAVRKVESKIKKLPGVSRVDSFVDAAKYRISLLGGIKVKNEPYFSGPPDEWKKLLSDKLYVNNLIDETGKVGSLTVTLNNKANTSLLKSLRNILKSLPLKCYITGGLAVDEELYNSIWLLSLFYPPGLFFIVWLIYFLRLRDPLLSLLPLIVSLLASALSYSFAVFLNIHLNVLTATTALFVIVIGSAYSLHLINRYVQLLAIHPKEEAVKISFKEEKRPLILSALTTMIGFASFAFIPSKAFREMSMLLSFGIFMCLILTLVLIPAFLKVKKTKIRKTMGLRLNLRFNYKINIIFIIIVSIIVVLSPIIIRRINVNSDNFGYFKKNSSIRKATYISNKYFGWTLPLYLMIEKKGMFLNSDQVVVRQLEDKIRSVKGVSNVISAVDIAEHFDIPLGILQIFGSKEIGQFIHGDTMRLLIKTPVTDAKGTFQIVKRIKEFLKGYDYHFKFVGPGLILYNMNSRVINAQIQSILMAFIMIFLLLLAIFRKPLESLIAILPIALTVLFQFIFMGIAKINLEISTSIVAGILMGLSIDYSIHIINWHSLSKKAAVDAVSEVGPVILTNALSLAAGFSTLFFAPMLLYARIAYLLVTGMICGAFFTLLFIPFLISKVKKQP